MMEYKTVAFQECGCVRGIKGWGQGTETKDSQAECALWNCGVRLCRKARRYNYQNKEGELIRQQSR